MFQNLTVSTREPFFSEILSVTYILEIYFEPLSENSSGFSEIKVDTKMLIITG